MSAFEVFVFAVAIWFAAAGLVALAWGKIAAFGDGRLPPPSDDVKRRYSDAPGGGNMRSGWRS